MDLRALLTFARRWAWLLIGATVIAAGVASAAHSTLSPHERWQAEAVVLVGPALAPEASATQLDAAERVAGIYAQVATSRPVLERVSAAVNDSISVDDLEDLISADTPGSPPLLSITASGDTAEMAVTMANTVVAELQAAAPDLAGPDGETRRFLQQQIDAIEGEIDALGPQIDELESDPARTAAEEARLNTLQTRLTQLRDTYASLVANLSTAAPNQLTVVELASVPAAEPSNAELLTALLAALFGFALATMIALLFEKLDDTLRSVDAIKRATGFRNLGEIIGINRRETKRHGRMPMVAAPQSRFSESVRAARINIEFAAPEPFRSLLVTSAQRNDGRTVVASNLAVAFARAGNPVLLVDADVRKPGIHRQFGIPNLHGLSDLLLSPRLAVAGLIQDSGVPGLSVITSGIAPRADAGLANLFEMKGLVDRLTAETEALIILDGPPILDASETAVLASSADATILLVSAGRTSGRDLHNARELLMKARARVLGTIVDRVPRLRIRAAPVTDNRRLRDQAVAHWLREDDPKA